MNRKQTFPFLTPGSLLRRSTASMLAMIALGGGVAWGAVSALADQPGPLPTKAIAARTVSVRESLHASEVLSHKGNTVVNERGRGTGTFNCRAGLQVRISYTTGTVNLTCVTRSGNVVAGGTAAFFTAGPTATFTGTMAIAHGTGKYSHAKGRFHVEGSMVRKTFALSATVSGLMSY